MVPEMVGYLMTLAGFLYLMNVPVIPIRERSKK